MSTASKFVVPSTSKFPLKSAFPASVREDAMSTAPSMSTASKFVVPSTSMFPLRSILPLTVSVEPSNVRLPESSNAPDEPAITTRLFVRSLTVAEDRTVSAPEIFAPPLPSIVPVTVSPAPTVAVVDTN